MFGFEKPLYLLLLLSLPLYYLIRRSGLLVYTEFPLTLGDWKGRSFRWHSIRILTAMLAMKGAAVLAVALIIFAISGPVLYRQELVYSGSGTEIFFVLDISPSMAARDLSLPGTNRTRLDTAREFIGNFVTGRPGDSFALVAVGNQAALLVPPTADHELFKRRLNDLRIGELGDDTAFGMGLAVAAAHLAGRQVNRSFVILLTDGENNAGELTPETASPLIKKRASGFFVIGIGKRGEVPLEYTDPLTGKQYSGFLDSRYNESALRELSSSGGGLYFSAASPESLQDVFLDIGKSVPSNRTAWPRVYGEPLEHYFIITALILAALSWFLRRIVLGTAL